MASMNIKGELRALGAVGGASTQLGDLGLDAHEGAGGGHVDLKWGSPHLSISSQGAAYNGSGILDSSVTLDGQTFPVNTPVNSRMDMNTHSMLLTFDILPSDLAELGFGFGVSAIDFLLALEDPATEIEIIGASTIPIPVLGVQGMMWAGPITLHGRIAGMSISVPEGEMMMLDYDFSGRYGIVGGTNNLGVSLTLGWRETSLDLQYDDAGDSIDLDFTNGGPYVGLHVAF